MIHRLTDWRDNGVGHLPATEILKTYEFSNREIALLRGVHKALSILATTEHQVGEYHQYGQFEVIQGGKR